MSDIRHIADHYGVDAQRAKTIEELAELVRAFAKNDYENIVEEMADVYIMLEQMKYLLHIGGDEIIEVQKSKLERTLAHIKRR